MMHPRNALTVAIVSCTATILALTLAPAADALPGGNGDEGSSGDHDNGELTAEASATQIVVSGDTGGEGGSLEPVDTGWTPPVCWYEPWMTAEEFRNAVEEMAAENGRGDRAININSPHEGFTDIYRDQKMGDWLVPQGGVYDDATYENYNLDAEEEGVWWRGVINPNREDEFRYGTDCIEPIFWSDPVNAPEVEDALTDETLAEYAYDEIDIPETEIELNPEGRQLVNLPTWVWLDASDFEPRTVRAELPINGLWAETTAEPVSLTLDPGTEDAELFPSDGECEIDDDGRIGEPYERGHAEEDPPCGVMYTRATHHVDSYELTASLTWEVHWTGSQTQGEQPLPSGTFETTHEIVVNENQTIVR
jgi:hypothetical protein